MNKDTIIIAILLISLLITNKELNTIFGFRKAYKTWQAIEIKHGFDPWIRHFAGNSQIRPVENGPKLNAHETNI